jgi:uncharacterized protein YbcI
MTFAEQHSQDGRLAAEISNAIVGLIREYTGRGPTQARTTIDGNLVVCLVQDALTKGERALAARGREDDVRGLRRSFQDAMRPDAAATIEELTGRRVVGFMSDNHIDPDLGIEAFVLEQAAD